MRILNQKNLPGSAIKIQILILVSERPNLGVNLTIFDQIASFQGKTPKFGARLRFCWNPQFCVLKMQNLGLQFPDLLP